MKMLLCADAFGHDADLKTFTQELKFGGKREKKKKMEPTDGS